MKYVKNANVVKEVPDNLAGDYVMAGWKLCDKTDYERTFSKTEMSKNKHTVGVNDGKEV